ncbi:MAG: YafY family protein [Candidatus Pseudobacter hemicellulosilyticus]|uniref:YafY family protein n=1 Tax=Candidatus Pseudobacter hemicellulosilyticus TaxID=3121375 RepID=A0AAJ5WU27_9BACT|nr:MAG: YafY family protein [Pseudobacter sp.]
MNRIDRLHAILTHLQSKKRVTAQEIANRFHISLRTVYRDVKALDESGVPVIGEAGSGYSIMEGYRLPPVMFSPEEANALLLGGKLAEKMSDASVQKHFEAALYKIKAVMRSSDKDNLDHLTDHIAVMRYRPVQAEQGPDPHLAVLQRCIVEKRAINICYQSGKNDEETHRIVEPIGLWYYSQYWHLIGWCRLRNNYRDFRVNRIQRLQTLDERFLEANHPTLKAYIESLVRDTSGLQEVVIRVDAEVARYIHESRYFYGFVREEKEADFVRMVFLTSSLHYFGRWLLMFTGGVQVESPVQLQEELRRIIALAQEQFSR